MGIGNKLSVLLDKRKTNPNELAKKVGVSPQTIYSIIKRDSKKADIEVLLKIADILDVSVEYFIDDSISSSHSRSESFSIDGVNLIKKYAKLDPHGKEVVDFLLNKEYDRCTTAKEQPATIVEFTSRSGDNHLMKYFRSASAGTGVFILGNEATSTISISEDDWLPNGDFVINVDGDSMIPLYNDGDKVIVSQSAEIQHGDIGIFVVNGNVYIKEYGQNELISKNKKAGNIKISEYDNIVCMGKVIGKITGDYEIMND